MKVQTETRNHRAGDVLFHGGDVLVADARHVVPKALTGELPGRQWQQAPQRRFLVPIGNVGLAAGDRKSTRLNSSHLVISYAVFCLKKKSRTALVRVSCFIFYYR